jgi:hypothetical protein
MIVSQGFVDRWEQETSMATGLPAWTRYPKALVACLQAIQPLSLLAYVARLFFCHPPLLQTDKRNAPFMSVYNGRGHSNGDIGRIA